MTVCAYASTTKGEADIYLSQLAYPKLTANAPRGVRYNTKAKITGTLKTAGAAPVIGKAVTLQGSTNGTSWVSDATTSTGALGAYALFSPALMKSTWVRVRFAEDANYLGVVSVATRVTPTVYLTTPSSPSSVKVGTRFFAVGYLNPLHAPGSHPVLIECYRYQKRPGGTYGYVLRKTVSAKAYSYPPSPSRPDRTRYVAAFTLPYTGRWRLRAYHPTDSANLATRSGWRSLTVKP